MKMTSNVVHKFDKKLKKKYDLVVKRITNPQDKSDALVLFEGDEGEGKTNHSLCFADYVSQETGRELVNSSVFFDVAPMIEIAKKEKGKIFIWDEPALQGLKKQWWNKAQINLTQLLMMARKNRHLFIFNITDFTEFNKYVIRRAVCMVRIYRRSETRKERRFLYFPRKKLRAMFDAWNAKRKRQYNKFKTLHGSMGDGYLLPLIIDESVYERSKDEAIMSIGEEVKQDAKEKKLLTLQMKIAELPNKIRALGYPIKNTELAQAIGISSSNFTEWKRIGKKTIFFENPEVENSGIDALTICKVDTTSSGDGGGSEVPNINL